MICEVCRLEAPQHYTGCPRRTKPSKENQTTEQPQSPVELLKWWVTSDGAKEEFFLEPVTEQLWKWTEHSPGIGTWSKIETLP